MIQSNSLIPITEKVYQHGNLKNGTYKDIYKLNTNKFKPVTCIIFSSNGELLDYRASINEDNPIIIDQFFINGKNITCINPKSNINNYIYLSIFTKNEEPVENDNITNYVFKYLNLNNIFQLNVYEVVEPNITFNNVSSMITLEAVKCDNCTVTYFANFIFRNSLIQNETFNNIAVIKSPGIVKEFNGNNLNITNDQVNLSLEGIPSYFDYACIQVIAYVNFEIINEYIAYNSILIEKENTNKINENNNNQDNDKTLLIIFISTGCFFVIIVLILVFVIFRFYKNNKDLINKVNATSFQSDNLGCFNHEDENNPNFLIE